MPVVGQTHELFPALAPPPDLAVRPASSAQQLRPCTISRQLWLALHLPHLPLEALRSALPDKMSSGPMAVSDTQGSYQRVITCNTAAAHCGITRGMDLNAAHALVGDLHIQARDTGQETAVLEQLALWSLQFTPKVSLEPPDTLLLEVKGSLQLFGGAAALIQRIAAGLQVKKFTAVIALAPTPQSALWFSYAQKAAVVTGPALASQLAELPVQRLRWPEETTAVLQETGLSTIGDCLRMPRDGFSRRFGPELLLQLDQALNRAAQPRRCFIPSEKFHDRCDFDLEVEDTQRLERALEPALYKLANFLRLRNAGIQGLRIALRHRDRASTFLHLRFITPVCSYEHFSMILTERLARLPLAAAVLGARVSSGRLWSLTGESEKIFREADRSCGNIPRLIERLRARLGDTAVYGLQLVDEHRPEAAWKKVQPVSSSAIAGSQQPALSMEPLRPVWLLNHPQILEIEHGWPLYQGRLQIECGPERIETGWWDEHGIARDYYIASTTAGRRVWLYRERHEPHRWFLQGKFG